MRTLGQNAGKCRQTDPGFGCNDAGWKHEQPTAPFRPGQARAAQNHQGVQLGRMNDRSLRKSQGPGDPSTFNSPISAKRRPMRSRECRPDPGRYQFRDCPSSQATRSQHLRERHSDIVSARHERRLDTRQRLVASGQPEIEIHAPDPCCCRSVARHVGIVYWKPLGPRTFCPLGNQARPRAG